MSSYTVRVSGYDDDGAPAATTFTVDARDRADAANEALAAARDCGWQDCVTGRIEKQRPTTSPLDVMGTMPTWQDKLVPTDPAIAARLEELDLEPAPEDFPGIPAEDADDYEAEIAADEDDRRPELVDDDEPAGTATDPRPDPRTNPEAWTE